MFSICKQSHPATGVEFSITCRFFNNTEENIVTAGANILKVFRIIPDVSANPTEKYTGKSRIARVVNVSYNIFIVFYRCSTTKNALGVYEFV